jgi:AAA+ superfamily predicted ATPase
MTLTSIGGGLRFERLFDDALRHPAPWYSLGFRLSELFPNLAVTETGSSLFDVEVFARDRQCTIAARPGVYHQFDTEWDPGHGLYRRARIAWFDVTWNSKSLQVVSLSWEGQYSMERRYFVLGEHRDTCNAFLEAVARWNHDVRGEILVFSEGCFEKSTKLYEAISAASFDQLVLDGTLKQQIRDDFTQFLASREAYEQHGVPWKRGAIFIGPPGNGKTLCVKALVRLLQIPCIYVQSFESQYGTPHSSMEKVFNRARSTAPCMLVLEDIDALLTDGTRSYFLNELDGFAANTGVITLATTNHPERLDPSILERPSRFDRKYHFGLPTPAARSEYIATWNARLRPALRLNDAGIARVVELTHEFTFAYIQEVFVSSMMRWMATRDSIGILSVAVEQIELLRAQMQTPKP